MKRCPECKSYDVCIKGVNSTLHYHCVTCGHKWDFNGVDHIAEIKKHLKHKHNLRELTFDDLVKCVIDLCDELVSKS